MDRLALYASLSYLLLLISFICMYYVIHKRTKSTRYIVLALLIACGTPLTVALINHNVVDYVDANIGLGLSFMLTWFITGLVFLLSLIIRIRKRTPMFK
ncbi:uncharacterized BrkB/YihY/UPF0761 family membrane protein [Paenibacillus sp. DS2015]|uniref:potassium transporter Kef n=1 Tax=Paenibacillus sp. DS2015 TaxID=3373917 RepID=UPI003D1C3441